MIEVEKVRHEAGIKLSGCMATGIQKLKLKRWLAAADQA
jgi:hypothetical protein